MKFAVNQILSVKNRKQKFDVQGRRFKSGDSQGCTHLRCLLLPDQLMCSCVSVTKKKAEAHGSYTMILFLDIRLQILSNVQILMMTSHIIIQIIYTDIIYI